MSVGQVSLMERLRDETRAHHQRSEQHALERAMLAGTISRDTYVALLGQRFWVHRELEAQLRTAAEEHPAWTPFVEDRLFQEPRLRADLAFFGRVAEEGEPMPGTACLVREIQCVASRPVHLLGYHYVLEGSKNGGRYIARSIAKAFNLAPGPGLSYLDPHGDAQHEVWALFKAAMDGLRLREHEAEAVVASARLAFDGISVVDDAVWSEQQRLLRVGEVM